MTKFVVDAAKLKRLEKAAHVGGKSFTEEVEALKDVAVDGRVPKEYAKAYKIAVILGEWGLPLTKANRAKAEADKDMMARAANRLTRRVKAAGLQAANNSGRKRGSTTAKPTGTPAQHAPQPAQAKGPTLNKNTRKIREDAAQTTFAGMKVPELSTAAQLDQTLQGLMAFARAVQTANPDAVDDVNSAALMQMTAAVENLLRARRDEN